MQQQQHNCNNATTTTQLQQQCNCSNTTAAVQLCSNASNGAPLLWLYCVANKKTPRTIRRKERLNDFIPKFAELSAMHSLLLQSSSDLYKLKVNCGCLPYVCIANNWALMRRWALARYSPVYFGLYILKEFSSYTKSSQDKVE